MQDVEGILAKDCGRLGVEFLLHLGKGNDDISETVVPIVHENTYEELRDVSPLLGSRTGLNTAEEPMADVADKLADLVAP